MKKALSLWLSLFIVTAFIFGAVTASAQQPAPQYKLKYATGLGQAWPAAWDSSMREWSQAVYTRTGGKAGVEPFLGGSLLAWKGPEMEDGVKNGVAQIGQPMLSLNPSGFPYWRISGVHDFYYGRRTALEHSMISRVLYNDFPELRTELEKNGLYLLAISSSAPSSFLLKQPAKSYKDFKGRKLRTYGDVLPAVVAVGGAQGTSMAAGEVASALDKGVVEGCYTDFLAMRTFGWSRYAKNILKIGSTGTTTPFQAGIVYIFNLDTWKGLPDDIKTIMLDEAKRTEDRIARLMGSYASESEVFMAAEGVKTEQLSEAEAKEWAEKAGVWDKIASDLNKMGLKGTEVKDKYFSLHRLPYYELRARWEKAWEAEMARIPQYKK